VAKRTPRPASTGQPPSAASHEAFYLSLGGQTLLLVLDQKAPLTPLTGAEQALLSLVREGHSNARIASLRGTRPRTVINQLTALYRKLGVRSRTELLARRTEP